MYRIHQLLLATSLLIRANCEEEFGESQQESRGAEPLSGGDTDKPRSVRGLYGYPGYGGAHGLFRNSGVPRGGYLAYIQPFPVPYGRDTLLDLVQSLIEVLGQGGYGRLQGEDGPYVDGYFNPDRASLQPRINPDPTSGLTPEDGKHLIGLLQKLLESQIRDLSYKDSQYGVSRYPSRPGPGPSITKTGPQTALPLLGEKVPQTGVPSLDVKGIKTAARSMDVKGSKTAEPSLTQGDVNSLDEKGPKIAVPSLDENGTQSAVPSPAVKGAKPSARSLDLKIPKTEKGTQIDVNSLGEEGPKTAATFQGEHGPHIAAPSLSEKGPKIAAPSLVEKGPHIAAPPVGEKGIQTVVNSLDEKGPNIGTPSVGKKSTQIAVPSLGAKGQQIAAPSLGVTGTHTSVPSLDVNALVDPGYPPSGQQAEGEIVSATIPSQTGPQPTAPQSQKRPSTDVMKHSVTERPYPILPPEPGTTNEIPKPPAISPNQDNSSDLDKPTASHPLPPIPPGSGGPGKPNCRAAGPELADLFAINRCYRWVRACQGYIPPYAVDSGIGGDRQSYVANVYYEGLRIPGKVYRGDKAYIAHGGKQIDSIDYQVLIVNDTYCLRWTSLPSGIITPADAIQAGSNHFVCRILINGTFQLGKYNPLDRKCYAPYGGVEQSSGQLHLLVQRPRRKSPYRWVREYGGNIPPGAVIADEAGENSTYVSHSYSGYSIFSGRVIKGEKSIIVTDGKHQPADDYEVLVADDPSIMAWVGFNGTVPTGFVDGGMGQAVCRVKIGDRWISGRYQMTIGDGLKECHVAEPGGGETHEKSFDILVAKIVKP